MSKTRKTTMSVLEMRQLLGIGKTDSYWLVHKQCFETILVEGKMRVVIDSFEHWYANQIKYKKVDGTPPGEELRSNSYSPPEIAEMLGLCESVIYDIIKRYDIETFQVDYWTRVRKDVFEAWYENQTKYRTKEDRERDAELEAASMTMPEIARLLMITRDQVYNILNQKRNKGLFEFVYIADQRRITKESFERWYAGQEKYCKLCDRPESEIAAMERKQQEMEKPRLQVDETKEVFTLQEAAVLLDVTYKDVRKLILTGELEAKKYGTKYLISKDDIKWFVFQQELEREN